MLTYMYVTVVKFQKGVNMMEKEKDICVFVDIELLLHEYGFEKLRELLDSPTQLEMFDSLEESTDDDGDLTIIPHPMADSESKTFYTLMGEKYLFISVENLRFLVCP